MYIYKYLYVYTYITYIHGQQCEPLRVERHTWYCRRRIAYIYTHTHPNRYRVTYMYKYKYIYVYVYIYIYMCISIHILHIHGQQCETLRVERHTWYCRLRRRIASRYCALLKHLRLAVAPPTESNDSSGKHASPRRMCTAIHDCRIFAL